ncbi:hypothetical protein CONPUDRAFT_149398 [Coniophora puteana RWD-64-598 SS2]|uniref:Uncharacterized protein n=1 Tax=Coniophora puteana (strain RWD-64-598) TaxID=741705 RepID=A0A5M3N885_CONPW|nr:uncharacterized protein CONPUDRAFT_149398 [Coniophora puteana RWD-64-598 SS2]EIW87367.1 hypothetical protein CONPUDRAFT_149398 [Coniophora puteana RWD-64-598 SS2]
MAHNNAPPPNQGDNAYHHATSQSFGAIGGNRPTQGQPVPRVLDLGSALAQRDVDHSPEGAGGARSRQQTEPNTGSAQALAAALSRRPQASASPGSMGLIGLPPANPTGVDAMDPPISHYSAMQSQQQSFQPPAVPTLSQQHQQGAASRQRRPGPIQSIQVSASPAIYRIPHMEMLTVDVLRREMTAPPSFHIGGPGMRRDLALGAQGPNVHYQGYDSTLSAIGPDNANNNPNLSFVRLADLAPSTERDIHEVSMDSGQGQGDNSVPPSHDPRVTKKPRASADIESGAEGSQHPSASATLPTSGDVGMSNSLWDIPDSVTMRVPWVQYRNRVLEAFMSADDDSATSRMLTNVTLTIIDNTIPRTLPDDPQVTASIVQSIMESSRHLVEDMFPQFRVAPNGHTRYTTQEIAQAMNMLQLALLFAAPRPRTH